VPEVQLPNELQPLRCADLVRLGKDHDGGYLVSAEDIRAAECLVGLGLNDDWSFEADFLRQNDCPLAAYDGSVGGAVFLRQVFLATLRPGRLHRLIGHLETLASYLQVFRGARRHVRRFVTEPAGPKGVPFSHVSDWIGKRQVFLKVDIEGAEYGLLDGITQLSDQLTGLVIEIHDCPQRIDAVCRFVSRLDLALVHVHANNFGGVTPEGLPKVIELTFSAHALRGSGVVTDDPTWKPALPHPLDQPNNPGQPELAIRFDRAGQSRQNGLAASATT